MYYPQDMLDEALIANLRYLHGAFNLAVAVLVWYQFRLGLRLRKGRLAGAADASSYRRHRRIGPVAVGLGVTGFGAGLTLVYLDHGHVLEYPLHFGVGLALALLLAATVLVSRKIGRTAHVWRRLHFVLGITIVLLYVVQVFLGLGVLL
jgi:cytochrome b561